MFGVKITITTADLRRRKPTKKIDVYERYAVSLTLPSLQVERQPKTNDKNPFGPARVQLKIEIEDAWRSVDYNNADLMLR